jgi:hypothetical protein
VKIKTSIGQHPVVNYLSTFTNDEIMEGKKHLLNKWRRDPSKPLTETVRSPSPGRRGGDASNFKIDVNETGAGHGDSKQGLEETKASGLLGTAGHSTALLPKARAPGGIWLAQSDFPHAF